MQDNFSARLDDVQECSKDSAILSTQLANVLDGSEEGLYFCDPYALGSLFMFAVNALIGVSTPATTKDVATTSKDYQKAGRYMAKWCVDPY